MIGGLRIIEDVHMTEPGDPCQIRRSWRDRLFTRPWRPLAATKTFIPQVPAKHAVINNRDGTVMMHPEMAADFKRQVKEVGGKLL